MFNTSPENKQKTVTCGGKVFADLPPQAKTHHINTNGSAMLDFKKIKSRKLRITFKTEGGLNHTVNGRVAQAIAWLFEQQEQGVTALEMSSWALRLGAYVHILRHIHNVNIRTDKESHDGGSHARYVLISPVEIVQIEDLSK